MYLVFDTGRYTSIKHIRTFLSLEIERVKMAMSMHDSNINLLRDWHVELVAFFTNHKGLSWRWEREDHNVNWI